MTEADAFPERLRVALEQIVERLAAGDYDGVAQDHSPYPDRDRVDLGLWARDYPDTFVTMPAEAWHEVLAVEIEGRPGAWATTIPLWGEHEGRTDMSLEVRVWEAPEGVVVVVDDLRAL
jgi:hypothetical protein